MKNNWQLITSSIIAIIILILFSSCGSRKTSHNKKSFKSDSLKIENNHVLKQEIILKDIYSIKPFEVDKPMMIDGKEYFNVVIEYDKSKFDNFEITKSNVVVEVIKESNDYVKETDKTDYTILFLGMFFISALFIFLWFKLKTPLSK